MKLTDKQKEIYVRLLVNGIDWYVYETTEGKIGIKHKTNLSAILDGLKSEKDCGFKWLKQCAGISDIHEEADICWTQYYLQDAENDGPADIVKWVGDELGREYIDLCE